MQTFTIMFESQSAQAGAISQPWPGVLRSTVDSSIIFRYVCDKSKTDIYNRIELVHYLPEKAKEPARFELVEFDLSNPALKGKARVHKNPSFCIDCHAAESDPYQVRPNWEMYPDWRGVFGSHDDIFEFWDKKSPLHQEKLAEKKKFHDFVKAKIQGEEKDECYTSLPWPNTRELPAEYANFPYGIAARSRNYTMRPNLKYSETLSHLLGVRNYSRIKFLLSKEEEKRKKIFLMLALEAAKCDRLITEPYPTEVIDYHLTQLLPKYVRPTVAEATIPILRGNPVPQHEPRHPAGMAQALYGASIALGFYPMDWTLLFIEYDRSDYESGGGFGGTGLANNPFPSVYEDYNSPPGDLPLTAYTQNEVLKFMRDEIPELKAGYWERPELEAWNGQLNAPNGWLFTTTRGEEEWFGTTFACIDDHTGAAAFASLQARESVCKSLRRTALTWGMMEGLPRGGIPKTRRGIEPPRIPPTRLKAFERYLAERFPDKRKRDAYIYSAAGLKEIKSQKFLDFMKTYTRN